MKRKTAKTIKRIWDDIHDEDPSISTEQLFARTCDRASLLIGRDIDNGDVGEALSMFQEEEA